MFAARLAVLTLCAVFGSPAQRSTTVCAACHPKQDTRYLSSAMGRSIGPAEVIPGGRAIHETSGSVLAADYRSGRMFHTLTERGVTAEYPVALQIGRGAKARTYAVRVGDYLLESPLSWYKAAGWDVSPGYESLQLLDFDRPITVNCLFCHADRAQATDADGRHIPRSAVAAIGCDRCHGDAAQHVRHPSSANIVNPAKLTGAARDSVCEQCHLEGETRVLNPGKTHWDFHPGEMLETAIVTYILREPGQDVERAVTQVEELAGSRCARESGGKLWCGTCHDPHGAAANRAAQMKQVCVSCHPALSKAAHPAALHECTSCHMPPRPANNVAHLAVTSHRLRKPGAPSALPYSGPTTLVAWREPPPEFRSRDLALAGLQLAAERKLPGFADRYVKQLEALPQTQQTSDPDVLSALEALFLGSSTPEKAVALSRWAVESTPESATFAMNYGLALMRAGDSTAAEAQLRRALALDPSLMQACAELAVLYDRENRRGEAMAAIERFLKWNPQNIQFRLVRQP